MIVACGALQPRPIRVILPEAQGAVAWAPTWLGERNSVGGWALSGAVLLLLVAASGLSLPLVAALGAGLLGSAWLYGPPWLSQPPLRCASLGPGIERVLTGAIAVESLLGQARDKVAEVDLVSRGYRLRRPLPHALLAKRGLAHGSVRTLRRCIRQQVQEVSAAFSSAHARLVQIWPFLGEIVVPSRRLEHAHHTSLEELHHSWQAPRMEFFSFLCGVVEACPPVGAPQLAACRLALSQLACELEACAASAELSIKEDACRVEATAATTATRRHLLALQTLFEEMAIKCRLGVDGPADLDASCVLDELGSCITASQAAWQVAQRDLQRVMPQPRPEPECRGTVHAAEAPPSGGGAEGLPRMARGRPPEEAEMVAEAAEPQADATRGASEAPGLSGGEFNDRMQLIAQAMELKFGRLLAPRAQSSYRDAPRPAPARASSDVLGAHTKPVDASEQGLPAEYRDFAKPRAMPGRRRPTRHSHAETDDSALREGAGSSGLALEQRNVHNAFMSEFRAVMHLTAKHDVEENDTLE